ncbi:unnamed protein product [Mycena citricolor]|uniref:Mob1/phocein n=1 Tax=Mycena citricolor TaxID=2018698 RepID=A0AAD2H108_9AGAR|nr:unnamed protein product [Mycena citricolor]
MAQVQIQRPLRGSRISTFYPVKTLPSLSSLDSAFQLQEYISLLIRLDVHDVDAIVSVPGRGKQKESGSLLEPTEEGKEKKPDVVVDEACWKYEQLRRLAQDLSHPLITSLQQVCNRSTCPEMKAGEWLYLCVAHGNEGAMEQCCAIDYILHTLDSATALLNSPRAFPSRMQIPPASHRHFSSLARRLGRIFAHAYFHHREEFEQAEAESSLYARFLALTEKFELVPADFLVIPPRIAAAPIDSDRRSSVIPAIEAQPPTLLAAALHVETAPSPEDSLSPVDKDNIVSPGSSLDEAMSPRRYGRNRTDTMMLEGDRFPPSPAVAAEDGPVGLEAALADAALADLPSVSASPAMSESVSAPHESSNEAPEADLSAEPESISELSVLQKDSDLDGEPSPTGGSALAPEPEESNIPIVSPSSSTAAIPLDGSIIIDTSASPVREAYDASVTAPVAQAEESQSGEKSDAGEQSDEVEKSDEAGEEKAELVPVPAIAIEPATPPDEAGEPELEAPAVEADAGEVENVHEGSAQGAAVEPSSVEAQKLEEKSEEEVDVTEAPTIHDEEVPKVEATSD